MGSHFPRTRVLSKSLRRNKSFHARLRLRSDLVAPLSMGDSDDEETAMLRAMRSTAARMDARGGGGGMQALLDKQRRAQQAAASRSASFFDDDDAPSAAKKARTRSPPGRQEGRPEPLVLEPAADEDAALRAMFPGGFGAAKKKTGAPAAASNRAPSPPAEARAPPREGATTSPALGARRIPRRTPVGARVRPERPLAGFGV